MFAAGGTARGTWVISAPFGLSKIIFICWDPVKKPRESNLMQCQTPLNLIKVWGQNPSYVEANIKKKITLAGNYPPLLFIYTVPQIMFEPWLGDWIFSEGHSNRGCWKTQQTFIPAWILKSLSFLPSGTCLGFIWRMQVKITINYLFTPKRYWWP